MSTCLGSGAGVMCMVHATHGAGVACSVSTTFKTLLATKLFACLDLQESEELYNLTSRVSSPFQSIVSSAPWACGSIKLQCCDCLHCRCP